jgi:phosphatidylglycerophosphatase B
VPVTQFYALKRKERAKLVHEQLAQAQDIPPFLRKHWQKETGFAFPSGHTMFAASWALLAPGCCGRVGAGARSPCCWRGRRR